MFILDGQPLPVDVPFTTADGTQYPADWLRLSTLEEKEAIGITEVPDPPSYDQRFYWGYDAEGNLIPKDHAGLVKEWVSQTRLTANALLAPSDWMVTREVDNGSSVPADFKAWRQEIRTECEAKVATIEATTTTNELAAYIIGDEYPAWSPSPDTPALADPAPDTE